MNLNRSILPFAVVALFVACSQQGEGERCVTQNGHADCASGLTCWAADKLVEYDTSKEFAADRCCPPKEAKVWSDSRCDKSNQKSATISPTGTAGAAGSVAVGSAGATAEAPTSGGSSSGGSGGENAGAAGTLDQTAGAAGSGA